MGEPPLITALGQLSRRWGPPFGLTSLEKAQHRSIKVVGQLLELVSLQMHLRVVVVHLAGDITQHHSRQQHALASELIKPKAIEGALLNQHAIELLPARLQRIK